MKEDKNMEYVACDECGKDIPYPEADMFYDMCEACFEKDYKKSKENMTLNELTSEVGEWSEENFGQQESFKPLLGVMEELGELSHAHLKKLQGIRVNENHDLNKKDAIGDIVIYLANYCYLTELDLQKAVYRFWEDRGYEKPSSLSDLQKAVKECNTNPLSVKEGHLMLFAAAQHTGDLCSLYAQITYYEILLKEEYIGNLINSLAEYCALEDINLEDAIFHTWKKVKERNWKKNKEKGTE